MAALDYFFNSNSPLPYVELRSTLFIIFSLIELDLDNLEPKLVLVICKGKAKTFALKSEEDLLEQDLSSLFLASH